MSDSDDFRSAQLHLTPDQWVGLLNKEGKWLSICCGNVSATRDALAATLRENCNLSAGNARIIVRNAGTHDVIERAFFANTASEKRRDPSWPLDTDSPWPRIVRVCRELVPDEFEAIETKRSANACPGCGEDPCRSACSSGGL